MRKVNFIENLLQDVRYGLRTFVHNPSFTLVVVLTLALGIGANTAIFSLVNKVLLRPPPYPQPDRLVGIWNMTTPQGAVLEYQQRSRTIEMGAYTADTGMNYSGQGDAIRISATGVTSNLMPMLGVRPKLGRWFASGDELPGKGRPVILSYGFWQTQFGGDPGAVGRWITLNDVPRQVIGVMPAEFHFPTASSQLWFPIEFNVADRNSLWGPFFYTLFGRLREGASLDSARAEFRAVLPQVIKMYPWPMGDKYGTGAEVAVLHEHTVSDVRATLFILLGAVLLVLMVACSNVANLLLARSATRQREIAIRTALGASRPRIISQLLTESVLLSLVGGSFGCLLALITLNILKTTVPIDTAGLSQVTIDVRVLAFSAALSILTGLIFGLAPAWQASKPEIEQTLKANTQSSGRSRQQSRLSSSLVVIEVGLAVILVSGAGLLIKSLYVLSQINVGFTTEHLLTARVTPTAAFWRANNSCINFYRHLIDDLRVLPGAKDAAASDSVPLAGLPSVVLAVEDHPEYTVNSPYEAWEFTVNPTYLRTMEIPLLQGRNFTEADGQTSPGVVLVSKSLAEAFWPGQDAVGKRVKPSWQPQWRTVVGVVNDVVKYKALPKSSAWAGSLKGDVYFPSTQGIVTPPGQMTVVVRAGSNADLGSLSQQLGAAVKKLGPSIPVSDLRTMDQVVSDSVSQTRSAMWLFAAFAGLALLLGAVGIYSVISYSVTQRTREIGIRMAMGAQRSDVLKLVLRHGSILTLSGIIIGLAGALALTKLMASLLHGVRPTDPATFAVVAIVVAAAAIIAIYIPSRHATKVDPTVALKYE